MPTLDPKECSHPRAKIGDEILNRHGFHIRGCDPIGTYYLFRCLQCGDKVWDYEFDRLILKEKKNT